MKLANTSIMSLEVMIFESMLENNENNLVRYRHDIVTSYIELITDEIVYKEKMK